MTYTRSFEVNHDEYPFAGNWLVRDGVRMHCVDEGAGIPVLFLHGNPTWSYLYRNTIKALRSEARLIAPDYLGFGFSDHPPSYGYTPEEHAEWVNDLIDELGLRQIILVCQDWGGPIGLSVATRRPDDFAGMVILNTWCWPPTFSMRLFSFIMGGNPLARYLILKKNFFAERIVPWGIYHKEKIDPQLLAAYTGPFPDEASRVGTWIFPGEIRRSAEWLAQIESRLPVLREKPVQLLWAMRDPAFGKVKIIDRWQSIFPHAEVETLDDASHYLQEDRPDRVTAAVQKVLESVRASGLAA